MTLAAFTERLTELGASAEVIEFARGYVTAITRDSHGQSRSVTRDKVKEQARVRQKRRRDKLAAQRKHAEAQANDGADVTVHVTRDTSRDGVPESCDLSSFLPSLQEPPKEAKKARSENAREKGTRMQLGAVLSEEDRAAAIELGATPAAIPDMWAEFVDYWTGIPGQRGTKLGDRGWSGTWRNRVRTIVTKGNGNANGPHRNGTAQAPRSGATGQDAILAGMGRLADRVRARGDAERREREASDDGGATRGAGARLI